MLINMLPKWTEIVPLIENIGHFDLSSDSQNIKGEAIYSYA
jgi:hypothetical protein